MNSVTFLIPRLFIKCHQYCNLSAKVSQYVANGLTQHLVVTFMVPRGLTPRAFLKFSSSATMTLTSVGLNEMS